LVISHPKNKFTRKLRLTDKFSKLKMKYRHILILVGLVNFYHASQGQDGPPEGWVSSVSSGYLHQSNSDLDNEGEFGLDQATVQYDLSRFQADGNSYGFSTSYTVWGYDFSNSPGVGAAPWGDINMLDFGVPLRYKLDNGWRVFAVPSIRSTFEDNASFSDGLTYGGIFGASYEVSDRLTIGPGLGASSSIEESMNFFPIILINWELNDCWSVETGRGLGATLGPGVFMNYDPDKKWRIQFGGRYESLRFRLNDEGIAPGGAAEDKNVSFFTGARYSPNPGMQFSIYGGLKFFGSLTIDDNTGAEVSREDYDGAFIGGFMAKFFFK
jgi:hypothetical protein|tara:strand:+ start:1830 stop:2807 length:978 start_codon:yes stop_codon:yes gene_type:complete